MAVIVVEGMRCPHCSGTVQKALEELAGMEQVTVDLDSGRVTYSGSVSAEAVRAAIEAKGYRVRE